MAQIAIIGASGNVGQRLVAELASRGHQITAICRNPSSIAKRQGVTAKAGDVSQGASLKEILHGHDAIISSLRFIDTQPDPLIDLVRSSGVKRYLVVGGAGSLFVGPGQKLIDQPYFPAEYKNEAMGGAHFLEALKKVTDLEWTFFSPAAFFGPGERTGKFRLGKDDLIADATGKSSISYEDFAIAMADEIEKPVHIRQRFTIGY